MDSRRERTMKAVVAALNVASVTIDGEVHHRPPGLHVHRQRRRPIENDLLPATVVYLVEEDVELDTHEPESLNLRRMRLRLEHRAEGFPEDEALDPLVSWATKALIAEVTLSPLIMSIEERKLAWDGVELDADYGACAHDFEIVYQTLETNPEW